MIQVFHLTLKTPISFITEVISLILILSTCLVANWSVSLRHRRGDGFLETQPFICLCGLFILVIKNGNTYEIIYGNHPTNTLTSLHLHACVCYRHSHNKNPGLSQHFGIVNVWRWQFHPYQPVWLVSPSNWLVSLSDQIFFRDWQCSLFVPVSREGVSTHKLFNNLNVHRISDNKSMWRFMSLIQHMQTNERYLSTIWKFL